MAYAPVSHPFIERLIGTIRHEVLDQAFFWNATDLTRKLVQFQNYYNSSRVHRSLAGTPPAQCAGAPCPGQAALDHYTWRSPRSPPE
ncbi:MAG: integrase core domain-containing protein [Rhodocyclaceae bacterium]